MTLIEHRLDPGVLAAPIHRHSREDEISLVLAGRMGVLSDDDTVFALAGDVVFKPRGHWHTFWNAGDEQLRLLELITPGGLEELFHRLGDPAADYDPETLPALVAVYGCEVDFAATMPLVELHGLRF
ncbi:MAG TPA: cupin domain-containing protein [Microlunatus sp.]